MPPPPPCPICQAPTDPAGTKRGARTGREFSLRRCPQCGFAFVENPITAFDQIYDEAYYAGRGSDPPIDYAFEFEHPDRTVRQYEWRGWERMIAHLTRPAAADGAWLDFGCGCGTLVRYLRGRGRAGVQGFDSGAWADKARRAGLPILREDELAASGPYDVVTAIDVIEHVPDPIALLRRLRERLKPGGLLVVVTQNAEIAPRNFADWSYVRPEIHVSFFTPRALAAALRQTGFEPFFPGPVPGWGDVMRSRILKNLRIKQASFWERMLPWPLLSRLADARMKMNALPFGRAV